jgi:hypothetical protein
MKKSYLSLMVVLLLGLPALADTSDTNSENKLDEIRSICESHRKPHEMCVCLVKNLSNKIKDGQFSDHQLVDAILAAHGSSAAPDYMADLMTGLEYHCMENANYSGD